MKEIIRMIILDYVEEKNLCREYHGFKNDLSCLTNLFITREIFQ